MNRGAALAAAVLGVALFFSVTLVSRAAMAQELTPLPRGGSYVLDADPTVASAAVGLWFRAPAAGYDNATPGIANLAATAAAAAPLASGRTLYELVHSLGGELNIEVYPDIVGVGAVIPAASARRVVAAMTAAYFAPAIDDKAVKTARENAAVLGVQQRYDSDATLHDLLFRQIFAAGPAHYPPLPESVSALTSISAAEVAAFAKRAFRSDNAVLTLTGNVDESSISAVTDGSGRGSMDAPYDSTLAAPPLASTSTGSVDGVGLAWIGPPIADEKAATALDFVADYLFRDQTGIVTRRLDRAASDAVVTGQFITLHDPGVMIVTIGGGHPKETEQRVIAALEALQQPMDAQSFEAAREAFLYHVAADTQSPQERADNLGWYTVEGDLQYAPGLRAGSYEQIARSLDRQYVAEVVRRYLAQPVIVDLIAGTPQRGAAP